MLILELNYTNIIITPLPIITTLIILVILVILAVTIVTIVNK